MGEPQFCTHLRLSALGTFWLVISSHILIRIGTIWIVYMGFFYWRFCVFSIYDSFWNFFGLYFILDFSHTFVGILLELINIYLRILWDFCMSPNFFWLIYLLDVAQIIFTFLKLFIIMSWYITLIDVALYRCTCTFIYGLVFTYSFCALFEAFIYFLGTLSPFFSPDFPLLD